MKRLDFVKHLEINGCQFLREGSNHTLYINLKSKKISSIPRHREIKNNLVRKICRDLEIKPPIWTLVDKI